MLKYWLWLFSLMEYGSKRVINTYQKFKKLGITDFKSFVADQLQLKYEELSAENIMRKCSHAGVEIIPFWDDRYPKLLKKIPDYPAFLFVKGNPAALKNEFSISVVGTRSMTNYGRSVVKEVLYPIIKGCEFNIVSGLAYGIDSEVHKLFQYEKVLSAIPVAVLPGGPEDGIPSYNRSLYDTIINKGCAVWEFLPGTPLCKKMFAVRNRITAGLSKLTVVIEAPEKSGSLITADLAIQYNRDVGSVPGSIYNRSSFGTNFLIKNGAYVITCANDIRVLIDGVEFDYDFVMNRESIKNFMSAFKIPDNPENYELLKSGQFILEDLFKQSNLESSLIRRFLTKFELEGILRLERSSKIKILK
ncbi:DNA-protecting protein DprA [Candidatus Dojkabacteria bacterium]|nr:DNA-protecting protein DprA [Candidatus Dojkabacteria bacterium]